MATSGTRRAAAAVGQVDGQDMPRLGFIPADPVDKRLTVDGAIFIGDAAHARWCDHQLVSDGSKLDIDAYSHLFTAFANEPLPEDHENSARPGVRSGDYIPKGLRVWDDVYAGASGSDGAGWTATLTKEKVKKEKSFNIRDVGSWRMAFLLARLQRESWEEFGDKGPLRSVLPDATTQATQSGGDPSLSPASPVRTPKRKECDGTSSPAKSVKLAGPATENLQPGTLAPSPSSSSLQMPAPGTKMSAMLERIRAREAALKVENA